jgi:hypothetical protein
MRCEMISMVESNVSYNSTDGSHSKFRHSFYFLCAETMMVCTMMYIQISVDHFDVTFRFVPESKLYGTIVGFAVTTSGAHNDSIPHNSHDFFRQQFHWVNSYLCIG